MLFKERYALSVESVDNDIQCDPENTEMDIISYSEALDEEHEIRSNIEQDLVAIEEAEDAIVVMQHYEDLYTADDEDDSYRNDTNKIIASMEEARYALANSMGRLGLSMEDLPTEAGIKEQSTNYITAIKEFIAKCIDMIKTLISHVNKLLKKLVLRAKMLFAQKANMLAKLSEFVKKNANYPIKEIDDNIKKTIIKLFYIYIKISPDDKTLDIRFILNHMENPNMSLLLELGDIFTNARNKYFYDTDKTDEIAAKFKELVARDKNNKKTIDFVAESGEATDEMIYITQIATNTCKCFVRTNMEDKLSGYAIKRYRLSGMDYTQPLTVKDVKKLGDYLPLITEVNKVMTNVTKYYDKLGQVQSKIIANTKALDSGINQELNVTDERGKIKRVLNINVRAARALSTSLLYDLVTQYTGNTQRLVKVLAKLIGSYQVDVYKSNTKVDAPKPIKEEQ